MSTVIPSLISQLFSPPSITSPQDWQKLLKSLLQHKLLSFSQQRLISIDSLKFPISPLEAQRILIQAKTHPDMVSIMVKIKYLKGMLGEIVILVEEWKKLGLSKEEEGELQGMVKEVKERIQKVLNELERFVSQTRSIDEEFIQVVEKLAEGEGSAKEEEQGRIKDKTAQQYQQQKYNEIEDYFNEIRVREIIQKPSKPLKTSTSLQQQQPQIHTFIALNKSDYKPVQVIRIPKSYNNYKKMQQTLNTFDALRQLSFSPYFPLYYGYSDNSLDPTNHNYFLQPILNPTLQDLLLSTSYHLLQNTPIFQHWSRELFFAFQDLLTKTTYIPILPITLSNIVVQEKGIEIKLKNVRFNRVRKERDNVGLLEGRLLRNYGLLLLGMLGLEEREGLEGVEKGSLRELIRALLRAEFEQKRYDEGVAAKRLSFKLCGNYAYFTKQFVVDAKGEVIEKNFQDIFKK